MFILSDMFVLTQGAVLQSMPRELKDTLYAALEQ